jgi:hypothetical protein
MPAPCEFCEACYDVRHDVRQLRDEIVRLEGLPPPRLPELPAPTNEELMMLPENAEYKRSVDEYKREAELERRKAIIQRKRDEGEEIPAWMLKHGLGENDE